MQNVREIAEGIIAREGGFVNDPDDPGSATNHGVTIHTLRRLGLDVNGDGAVDVGDVRALSRSQAVQIFINHYYERPGIAAMPAGLQSSLFDMYVNAGANAVKILQRLLNEMGYGVAVDGVIGAERKLADAREQQRTLERQAQEAQFQARALAARQPVGPSRRIPLLGRSCGAAPPRLRSR